MDEFEQAYANATNDNTVTVQETTESQPNETTAVAESAGNSNPTDNGSAVYTDEATDKVDASTENGNQATPNEAETPEDKKRREAVERHRQNNANAQRRIRQRESRLAAKDAEIERLRKKIEKLECKGELNELEQMRLDSLNDQVEDATSEYDEEARLKAQEEYDAFNDRVAYEVGSDNANDAIEKIQKYAQYVNKNERELVKMCKTRPYGTHLLYEWCTRMEKSPTALAQWESMTTYEKSRWMSDVYQLIVKDHQPGQELKKTQPPVNVAVAQSGRGNTISQPASTDDFGTAVERQMQKLGIKKF